MMLTYNLGLIHLDKFLRDFKMSKKTHELYNH